MKWIKASERLPDDCANARYNGKPGILKRTTGGCMFQGFNEGYGYLDNEPALQYVEWLDESVSAKEGQQGDIDEKIKSLFELTDEFIFPAYYSHTQKTMWKISNVFTNFGGETFVLCDFDEGISKALDLAVEQITIAKNKFYQQ